MITRSGRMHNSQILENSNALPWCSESVKLCRRKGKPLRQTTKECLKNLHIYDKRQLLADLRDIRGNNSGKRDEKVIHFQGKDKKVCLKTEDGRRVVSLFIVLFAAAVLLVGSLWWILNEKVTAKLLTTVNANQQHELLNIKECCLLAKNLAAALKRAEIKLKYFKLREQAARSSILQVTELDRENAAADVRIGSGTEAWPGKVALWGVVPLWDALPSPEILLSNYPPKHADCWAFRGSRGEVIIELTRRVQISTLSIEHVRPDRNRSAPRHFIFYGILENGTWIRGLESEYNFKGPARQVFMVKLRIPIKQAALRITSNQGNSKYTCVYRIQLRGTSRNY